MYLHVLVGLVLALLSLTLVGEGPPPSVWFALSESLLVAMGVWLVGLAITGYVLWRRKALEVDEQRFLRRVARLGRGYRMLVVAAYAVILWKFGWAALAASWATAAGWDAIGLMAALAPLVALQMLAWTAVYWADRALRIVLFERTGTVPPLRQWTLPRYLEFMLRQYLLVVIVPVLLLMAAYDGLSHTLGTPGEELFSLPTAAMLAALVAGVLLSGPWMSVCWRTERLPDGGARQCLEELTRRADVEVAELLVWRTNQTIGNGCLVGLVGPLRYIMITDALLLAMAQSPAEIESVFAHEVGHVKHRHTLLFMLLAVGVMGLSLAVGTVAQIFISDRWIQEGLVAAVVLAFWWLAFGYISRRCELEADLYAVRAMACPVGCSAPEAGASVERAMETGTWHGLCEHRVAALVTALRRIARLNGSPETAHGWRHFSIAYRCEYLMRLLANPTNVVTEERRLRRVKRLALVLALLLGALGAGIAMSVDTSEPNNPQNPAGPDDGRPEKPTWLVRLIDGNQVDVLALGAPQFHGQADPVANLDHRGLAGQGRHAAAANDEVAIENARGHAVAVHTQGDGSGLGGVQAGQFQELRDPLRRGRG